MFVSKITPFLVGLSQLFAQKDSTVFNVSNTDELAEDEQKHLVQMSTKIVSILCTSCYSTNEKVPIASTLQTARVFPESNV